MNASPLMIKSKELALEVIKVCKELRISKCESTLINQFLRSGTSVGANVRERITNGYTVTVDFQGFIEERKEFEYICVKKMLTSDGMKEFIRQLEAEYKPFLQR